MHIRITNLNDEKLVSELLYASYSELMVEEYDASALGLALPRMTHANPELLASGTFYIVEGMNSLAIGCGGWTLDAPGVKEKREGIAHLRHFATHPQLRSAGYRPPHI